MTHANIVAALHSIRPGSQWTMRGDTYADLDWIDEAQAKPSEADITAAIADLEQRKIKDAVNAERDRRLKLFPFSGKSYDFCDGRGSDINIAGAGTIALAAIMAGAQPGNLRWANPNVDFTWVASDNTTMTMDAHTVLNFAKAAADWKALHIRKARQLKDAIPIPLDFKSDARWTS